MDIELRDVSYGVGKPLAKRGILKSKVSSEAIGAGSQRRLWSGVHFTAGSGDTVAIKGPNGCGKSMLLKVLATLIEPWSGDITWQGRSVAKSRRAFRRQVSYSASAPLGFYGRLNAFENLRFFGGLAGRVPSKQQINQSLADVALDVDSDTIYSHFSLGMRQRLHLARVLLANRPLWLLDEPSNGLDTSGLDVLTQHLQPEADRIKIFVSHDHDLIAEVATQVVDLEPFCDV